MLPLAGVEHEFNPHDEWILDGWPEQGIKEALWAEHGQADVKPDHPTASLTSELFTRGPQLTGTDQRDLGAVSVF
jgi:hypothetical protein